MKKSKLFFKKELPTEFDFMNSILIYDQILEKKYRKWILRFPYRLKVRSGERLKSLSEFMRNLMKIHQMTVNIPFRQMKMVGFGGGSVGDFVGFTASVYKRGVSLVHIPSTWLSAMDSAHGGKTALNYGDSKNQIGTFYAADEVYLVKSVLTEAPMAQLLDSLGEYYKMALIHGGLLWKKASRSSVIYPDDMWMDLRLIIGAKMKIVVQDPYEKTGLRQILNLGHTVGHVLEANLKFSHGTAVLYGLRFAYEFGRRMGVTSVIPALEWMLPSKQDLQQRIKKIKNPGKYIFNDKKISRGQKLKFIFIRRPGLIVAREIKVQSLLNEWKRQTQG